MTKILSAGNNDYGLPCHPDVISPSASVFTPIEASKLPDIINIKSLSIGNEHCAAVYNDGSVCGWGHYRERRFGFPHKNKKTIISPQKIEAEILPSIKSVICGLSFTLFLSTEGEALIDIEENIEKLPLEKKCVSIFGFGDPWYVDEDFNIYRIAMETKEITKYNFYASASSSSSSQSSPSNDTNSKPKGIKNIVSIRGGRDSGTSTVILTLAGELYGTGKVVNKQKNSKYTSAKDFAEIESLKGKKIAKVSGIFNHFVALTDDGKIFVWGSNDYGQLGLGNKKEQFDRFVEVKPFSDDKIVDIAAGNSCSFFISEKRELFSVGNGGYGQTFFGDNIHRSTPEKVPNINNVVAVVCGGHYFTYVQIGGENSIFNNYLNQKQYMDKLENAWIAEQKEKQAQEEERLKLETLKKQEKDHAKKVSIRFANPNEVKISRVISKKIPKK